MDQNVIPLGLNDYFMFSCSKDNTCFTKCCRDLNQFLTPYDVMRLKNRLGITSDEFLKQHTTQHMGPETGLPVITFNPKPGASLKCPFVTYDGCEVYDDRPSSCRAYPLVRVASRSRETGKVTERYYYITEPHCLGFEESGNGTVASYVDEQGLEPYNEMNDRLMEIISLKNMLRPGQLDVESKYLFYLALYNLDTFRQYILENKFSGDIGKDPDLIENAEKDDVSLLKLGHVWIKKKLFGDYAIPY